MFISVIETSFNFAEDCVYIYIEWNSGHNWFSFAFWRIFDEFNILNKKYCINNPDSSDPGSLEL